MKAQASATAFSAMSSAAASCCIWWTRTCEHAGKAYKTVRTELEAYEGHLADKIEIVALNKIDAVTPDELKKQKDRLKRAAKKTPLLMSGVTGEGVERGAARAGRGDRRSPGVRQGQGRGAGRAVGALDDTARLISSLHFRVNRTPFCVKQTCQDKR